MASLLLKCMCCRDSWNLNCKLRSFLARDFIEGGQGLPWEPWLEGSCLHTEAQSQDCSEFAPMNLASKKPSINCHLPLPSPPSLTLWLHWALLFSEAVVKIIFSLQTTNEGKPYSLKTVPNPEGVLSCFHYLSTTSPTPLPRASSWASLACGKTVHEL